MLETESKATSPATPAEKGDAKKSGNIRGVEAAAQHLLEKYNAQANAATAEKPKTEATDVVTPPAGAENAAPSSNVEPPAQELVAEPEVKPEGEPETQPEGEDVLSQDTNLTPEEREKFRAVTERWQAGVNERIGKEKRKRLDAEAKAKELEAKLASVPTTQPEPVIITAPTPENPLADVGDFQSLAKRQKDANDAINSAQTLLDQLEDSGEKQIQVGNAIYTTASLREIRREAEKTLREHIPARSAFLQQQQQARAGIAADFPELLDRNTKAYQEMQQVKARYPMLAYLPDADYWIGLALEGAKAVQARKTAKTTAGTAKSVVPAPSKQPPAAPIATSAAINAASRGKVSPETAMKAEEKRVFSGGNVSVAKATELLRKRELSKLR